MGSGAGLETGRGGETPNRGIPVLKILPMTIPTCRQPVELEKGLYLNKMYFESETVS